MPIKSSTDCTPAGGDGPAEDSEAMAMGALEADLGHLPSGARALIAQRRALEQLARLYDLGLDNRTTTDAAQTYASPEEVAAAARERMLELHERSE